MVQYILYYFIFQGDGEVAVYKNTMKHACSQNKQSKNGDFNR